MKLENIDRARWLIDKIRGLSIEINKYASEGAIRRVLDTPQAMELGMENEFVSYILDLGDEPLNRESANRIIEIVRQPIEKRMKFLYDELELM